jgi:hypothetical protein
MVRLGSNFFDAYNTEIGNLRRRRKENADAFNAFVELKKQNGEKVTAEELESYKRNISNGDFYFAQGLPNSQMLSETARRLSESAVHTRQTEQAALASTQASTRGRNLQNLIQENEFATTLVGQTLGLSEEERAARLPQIFESNGLNFDDYSARAPGMLTNAQIAATQSFMETTSFNDFTTQEGVDMMLTQAPAYLRDSLRAIGENNIRRNNETLQTAAIDSVAAAIPQMVTDAGGDQTSLRANVRARLSLALNTRPDLVTDALINQALELADARFQTDRSGRIRAAIQTASVTNDQLIAAGNDETKLRALATTALTVSFGGTPPDSAIDQMVDVLRADATTAVNADRQTRLDNALATAGSVPFEVLDNLDTADQIDEFVEGLLADSGIRLDELSESERAAMIYQVMDTLDPLIRAAQQDEFDENERNFQNAVRSTTGLVVTTINAGNIADEESVIFGLINDERESNNLPTYGNIDAWKNDPGIGGYEWYQRLAKPAAQRRYAARIATETERVTARVDADLSNQTTELAGAGSLMQQQENGDAKFAVFDMLVNNYYLPRELRSSIINQIEAAVDRNEISVGEAMLVVSEIVRTNGLVQQSVARDVYLRRSLSNLDLIEPDTNAMTWFNRERTILEETVRQRIAELEALPMDADEQLVTDTRQAIIEAMTAWQTAIFEGDVQDADIQYNLGELQTNLPNMEAQAQSSIDALEEELLEVTPRGKPSFLFAQRGNNEGYFAVAPDGVDAAVAAGFNPEFLYRRNVNGEFEVTERRAAPIVSPTGSERDVDLSLAPEVTQVNPTSSPLVQDIQQILGEGDLTAAVNSAANTIAMGRDGGPASSPGAGFINYAFGNPDQTAVITMRRDALRWLRDNGNAALRQDPASITLLRSNPIEWARQKGWVYQQ